MFLEGFIAAAHNLPGLQGREVAQKGRIGTGMSLGSAYFHGGHRFRDFAETPFARALRPRLRAIGLEMYFGPVPESMLRCLDVELQANLLYPFRQLRTDQCRCSVETNIVIMIANIGLG